MTGRPQVPYLGGRFFGGVDDVLCPALRSAVAGSRRGRAFRLRDDAVPGGGIGGRRRGGQGGQRRSEEHTSELQSLMRISYAVFCLKKKKKLKYKQQMTNIQKLTRISEYVCKDKDNKYIIQHEI